VNHADDPISRPADAPEMVDAPEVVDCLGQRCPLPVIAAARRLPELPVGAVLRVLADDPAAAIDIPAWCRMRGQEFVGAATVRGFPAYDVRRSH
jgi:tRNA 2-thiouridine synthesizing protein A